MHANSFRASRRCVVKLDASVSFSAAKLAAKTPYAQSLGVVDELRFSLSTKGH